MTIIKKKIITPKQEESDNTSFNKIICAEIDKLNVPCIDVEPKQKPKVVYMFDEPTIEAEEAKQYEEKVAQTIAYKMYQKQMNEKPIKKKKVVKEDHIEGCELDLDMEIN